MSHKTQSTRRGNNYLISFLIMAHWFCVCTQVDTHSTKIDNYLPFCAQKTTHFAHLQVLKYLLVDIHAVFLQIITN